MKQEDNRTSVRFFLSSPHVFLSMSSLFSLILETFFSGSPFTGGIYFASLHVTVLIPDHLGKRRGIARERMCLVRRGLAQFEADVFAVLIIHGERRKEFKHSNGGFHPSLRWLIS